MKKQRKNRKIHSEKREGGLVVSVFDIIPNNFFNPLSSNSNYRTNAALLQFIYKQYDNEISYRIKRNMLRDEVAYYISEHSEEFLSNNDISNKSYQDISSDYLRRFASKEVGLILSIMVDKFNSYQADGYATIAKAA